ncbi:hypothetical protein Pan97_07380 [Bremerella volcania]|uniref:Uncharacterized protein n=1 Tax=Bremerella volcania TaxID=2527984 RepID=A0A518C3E2_9BACT|nr:hypothetical protein Pan97_07380 [Bremerella volcania]
MSSLVIALTTIALLFAIVALIRERRLVIALRQILRRLVERLKNDETHHRH